MTNRIEATLPEFLLARLSDQEREIRTGIGLCQSVSDHRTGRLLARLLRNCEAVREVVERCMKWQPAHPGIAHTNEGIEDACDLCVESADTGARLNPNVLRFLALPFADHPDYNEAWRP